MQTHSLGPGPPHAAAFLPAGDVPHEILAGRFSTPSQSEGTGSSILGKGLGVLNQTKLRHTSCGITVVDSLLGSN